MSLFELKTRYVRNYLTFAGKNSKDVLLYTTAFCQMDLKAESLWGLLFYHLCPMKIRHAGNRLLCFRHGVLCVVLLLCNVLADVKCNCNYNNKALYDVEKVAIFDEAQRAWDESNLTDFMKRKKGVPDFNRSEPEFLIEIMDRHQDWATIVCLVGGGQEIYTGEAGIEDWFRALRTNFSDWDIYLSDKMTDSEYIGASSVDQLLGGRTYVVEPSLHLGISLRSFRSEKLASFTKALLDNCPEEANAIYKVLSDTYPIYLTRDFDQAKAYWMQEQ